VLYGLFKRILVFSVVILEMSSNEYIHRIYDTIVVSQATSSTKLNTASVTVHGSVQMQEISAAVITQTPTPFAS
jgi:hypothetical protein